MTYDMILVRYGEMTLKKDNYKYFYKKIVSNIKYKCREIEGITFEAQPYRFYIYLNGVDYNKVIEKLNEVTGLWSYSLAKKCMKDIDAISNSAEKMVNEYVNEHKLSNYTFKVETARSDKQFPLTSLEISRAVAEKILPKLPGVSVDVHNPDVILHIDFRFEAAYIYTNAIKGLGGYPAGIQGKGLVMMSGGLDSPVSAYLAIKKGVTVSAIHFFSPPYTSYSALQKVYDLLEKISKYTENDEINLYVVPFTKIQDQIHNNADNKFMVTLMRRAMYKIATEIALNHDMQAIINGESIGQVASQTLESMLVVNDVTNIPIIRPLASFDKEDIVTIAKSIDTFDISIRPYEDCCTVFVPKHPTIKPDLSEVIENEDKCNMDLLIDEAIEETKLVKIKRGCQTDAFSIDSNEENKFEI